MMFFALLQNDVDCFTINDVMFVLHVPKGHIIAKGNIMREACIICSVEQTSFKETVFEL